MPSATRFATAGTREKPWSWCTQPSPRLRVALLVQHALFARTCSSPEFEETIRHALSQARDSKAPAAFARAALMLDLHPGFPALPGARAALEEARDTLPPEDEAMAAVLARLVTSAPTAYDAEQASAALARAAEAEAGANWLLAR